MRILVGFELANLTPGHVCQDFNFLIVVGDRSAVGVGLLLVGAAGGVRGGLPDWVDRGGRSHRKRKRNYRKRKSE